MMSCATHQSTTTSSTQAGKYSEDLSVVRPKLEAPKSDTVVQTDNARKQTAYVEPKAAITQQLDEVLDSIILKSNLTHLYLMLNQKYNMCNQIFVLKQEDTCIAWTHKKII
jgi:hypothetical protein